MAYLTTEMCPLITNEHLELLNRAGIWTINDLCSIDLMEIKRLTNIRYSILKEVQDKVRQRYTLPKNQLSFLIDRQIKEECRLCPTGLPELTQALDGGFQTQEIVEFFGDSESGKTEMCHLICGEILSHFDDYQILYIASNFDVDHQKIAKYTRSKAGNRELSDSDILSCLSRVDIARPTNLADLVHLLNTLVHSDRRNKIKCIIIDSLSYIIQEDILDIKTADLKDGDELERFSALKGNNNNDHTDKIRWDIVDTYLHELLKLITTISIIKNTIVIITNSDDQLTLHKSWTNALTHRIHLSKMSEFSNYYLQNPQSTICKAVIIKTIHNITKVGFTIPFAINDEGLFVIRPAATKSTNIGYKVETSSTSSSTSSIEA